MKNKKKIIIFISSLLLLFIVFVTICIIYNRNQKLDSNKLKEENIETKNNETTKESKKTNEIENEIEKPEQSVKSEETNKKENSNSNTTTNSSKPKQDNPNSSTNTETPVTEKLSWKEKNQSLITKIKNTYGYNVSYGEEQFWYGGTSSILLTDEELANKALNQLYNASAVFPDDFFKTFQGYNGFRVILYDHINGAAGVASYEFGDDNYLALDVNNGYLGRVFYHETFHLMEQYIKYKTYGTTNPFNNWSNSNPTDFIYGSTGIEYTAYDINELYSYDDPSKIAFVSEYAKTRANEDRAELFADLMFRPIKKQYMSTGFAINEKAKELSLILRKFFPNSTGARWEKYITW